MKQILFITAIIVSFNLAAQKSQTAEKPGYEIKVTFKPFKNQYIYFGHYSGKNLPIIDSVVVNDKSEGVFKGSKKLGQGVYLIGYPNKMGFFELLIGNDQHFSVKVDTADLKNISFEGSADNSLFLTYQAFMGEHGKRIDSAKKALQDHKGDSLVLENVIKAEDENIKKYRSDIIKKNPASILSFLLKLLEDPEVPPAEKHPGGKYDTAWAYNYYKKHYWDGINFYDDRLVRTPIFENKLDRYFQQVVYPHPDSVIKEIDWMLGYASVNEEMQKFLLTKFVNRYLNQKYMWEDAVFVHLFEKYFAQKNYNWLTEKGKKIIQDRAYSLMANILGNPASDIELPDTSGKNVSLYSIAAPYTVVLIYDPLCGHCREIVPKVDSLYEKSWKNIGVKVFAMAKEVDGTKSDWLNFVKQNHLQEWTNVFYSKENDKARVDAGIPSYSQLYDVQSFPTLYLLDKDKRIIAKKLTYEQINDVLQYKMNH
ncbi:MAG: hypothetical protein C4308_09530 [Chitinophagaceae bacterium]